MDLTVNEIAGILALKDKPKQNERFFRPIAGISTDTRGIKSDEVFVAIKGEHFNGHEFLDVAKKRKAICAIVECAKKREHLGNFPLLPVKNTILAFGQIAAYYRNKFKIPIIAITGSNGKTTTKEMVAAVLTARFNVLKNHASENNFIGVPKTLFQLNNKYSTGVVELGMNHAGEIRYLANLVKPQIAVITNIGQAHLEFFDDLKEIVRAKCEILEELLPSGTAVVNGENKLLWKYINRSGKKMITFGTNGRFDFYATKITPAIEGISFTLNGKTKIKLPVIGRVNVYNALAAIAVGHVFGIKLREIVAVLSKIKLPKLRMQVLDFQGAKIIADCYNANPSSVEAAIMMITDICGFKRRVVIIGDMLELGKDSVFYHQKIGKKIAKSNVDVLIVVGNFRQVLLQAARDHGMKKDIFAFPDIARLKIQLPELIHKNDLVLVKGSRRMEMEKMFKCFTTSYPR
ncbi:MAG: UDP-N-acetylmuramoyl-tripeptide--D-alanyl-D-alanine ligase [Candidatus Omnitrophota bacterium]